MPPRRRPKAPAMNELPVPIWTEIASHMSMKDWAMVSGTCKTTFTLQPRTLNIPSATPPAGVIWATKRLGNVEVLCLSPTGALGLAGTGMQDSDTLMSLKQLEIIVPSAADTTTAFNMWFPWVLLRAQKLTLLSATVGQIEWFPPMLQLKHLVLRLDEDTGSIFAALPYAKGLQTLSLHAGSLSGGALLLDAPGLDLMSLPDLRAVAFHAVCPDYTLLPEGCGYHLALAGLEMIQRVWSKLACKDEPALPNLRSLVLGSKDFNLMHVPDFFGSLRGLCNVELEVGHCGDADKPIFLESFAHLQQLVIRGSGEAYFWVPAKVSWQKLWLSGVEKLDLLFQDTDTFARTKMQCMLSCKHLAGTSLFQLCHTLAKHGLSWDSFYDRNDIIYLAINLGAGPFLRCSCGACMECLRATGVAEACPSVPLEDDQEDVSDGESGSEEDAMA